MSTSVWITGASGGLGVALAHGLAADGARLALTARPSAALDRLARELRKGGADVLLAPGSVSSATDLDKAAALIEKQWGALDGLVIAAGVSPTYASAENVSLTEWQLIIATNLTGTFLTARAAFPLMKEHGGSMVAISSVHGQVGSARLSAYCASKGGVELLTKSLALDWARYGIRVNAVAAGYFETQMTQALRASERHRESLLERTPMGRFGSPVELVGATAFLLSSASAYVTGSTLVVDGGWTAA